MKIFGIGMQELLIILLICLVVFGANKLPEIGRSLAKTIVEFKKALKETASSENNEKIEKK